LTAFSRYLPGDTCAGNVIFVQLTLDTVAQPFHDRAFHRYRDEPSLGEQRDNPLCASIADLGTGVQGLIVLNGGAGHVDLRFPFSVFRLRRARMPSLPGPQAAARPLLSF